MKLKKVESNNQKISFFLFNKFMKKEKKKIFIWNLTTKNKMFLIFINIYILLENKTFESKAERTKYYKDLYKEFSAKKTKKHLIDLLENKTDHKIDFESFYSNLWSFYRNSWILNHFLRFENKMHKFFIEENQISSYTELNKNMKFILSFIKETLPNKFNTIYRKILLLS